MKHYRIQVIGRVQGVFFRANTLRVATELGINGWVKNKIDGSVVISAQGEENQLTKLLEWCHQGPVTARVSKVNYQQIELESFESFEILR